MYQSPRMRRLRNDFTALERLRSESSVFRFSTEGEPPNHYRISFHGKGLWRDHGKVKFVEKHYVEIKLGSSYPRTIPEIRWLTPIYHPNISEIGMVCLGGYGTHWVPSVQLDELCIMLWDMVRYHNYDIRSPYNRDAALWVAHQTTIRFPTDGRPLRDVRAALGRVPSGPAGGGDAEAKPPQSQGSRRPVADAAEAPTPAARVRRFVQRYGRAFGVTMDMTADEPRSRRPGPAESARTLPSNSELRDLVAAQTAAAIPSSAAIEVSDGQGSDPVFIVESDGTVVAPPARGEVTSSTPPAVPEPASRPLFARPQPEVPGSPGAEFVDVAAEVRRLIAARAPAGPPSDEIVFIE